MLKKLNKIRNKVSIRGANPDEYINAVKSLKKQDVKNKEVYNAEIIIQKLNMSKSVEVKHRLMRKVQNKIPKLREVDSLYARYVETLSLLYAGNEKGSESMRVMSDEIYEYNAFYTNLLVAREQGLKREIKDFDILKYGILIKFNTETEKKCFLDRQMLRGDSFDANLANYMTQLDKMKAKAEKNMREMRSFPLKKTTIVNMRRFLETFCVFLEQNYVEHETIKKLMIDVCRVEKFLDEIVYRIESGRSRWDIANFSLEHFSELNQYIERDLKLFDSEGFNTKAQILEKVTQNLEKREILPFLPVFYDIAYDHIQFPEINDGNS